MSVMYMLRDIREFIILIQAALMVKESLLKNNTGAQALMGRRKHDGCPRR